MRLPEFATRVLEKALSPFDLRLSSVLMPPNAAPPGSGGWVPVVREPFPGGWQQNLAITPDSALRNAAVYACVSLIAGDVGKLPLRLVEVDDDGIWTETTNPAWSPVLRTPNSYQLQPQFVTTWLVSKLIHGNTYVLKERDGRGVVSALHILDPTRVMVLVTIEGDVYYQLGRDNLAGIAEAAATQVPTGTGTPTPGVAVPSSEIIHDVMVPLFHPLIGISPLFAAAYAAVQGTTIQANATRFFSQGSFPGGLITVPTDISADNAARLKNYWESEFSGANVGKVAVLGQGAKFETIAITATDAQLLEQLKWSAETICSVYHVPPYLAGIGPAPHYAGHEPLVQQYYSSALQTLMTTFEACLDAGLELPAPYGTEFDIDALIYMNIETRAKAAQESINAGALSPNEARKKFFGLGPVPGGDTPYLQQQYYSLAALAERDTATAPPPLSPAPPPPSLTPGLEPAPADAVEAAAPADEFTTLLERIAAEALIEGVPLEEIAR